MRVAKGVQLLEPLDWHPTVQPEARLKTCSSGLLRGSHYREKLPSYISGDGLGRITTQSLLGGVVRWWDSVTWDEGRYFLATLG